MSIDAGSKGGRHGRPGRQLTLTLVTAVGLVLAGCRAVSGQPLPGPSAQSFTGTVVRSCGPTDAPGLQLVLTPADARAAIRVSISLWGTSLPNEGLVKSFTSLGEGSGEWCSRADDCVQASSGTVRFDGNLAAGLVSGAFRLDAESGDRFEGTFEAQVANGALLMCG